MLQEYIPNISSISVLCCSKCFHIANCKCFIWKLHILQWLYTYVVSVCFKSFSCFQKYVASVYLDLAYVAVVIHMLQAYVLNISPVPNVCCSKSFHYQTRATSASKGSPRVHAQQHGMHRRAQQQQAHAGACSRRMGSTRKSHACSWIHDNGRLQLPCFSDHALLETGATLVRFLLKIVSMQTHAAQHV
jgi:hypothetical protein